ncbi:MAG: polysaccharide deacetylase family protein [Hyphomicrobium sp.]
MRDLARTLIATVLGTLVCAAPSAVSANDDCAASASGLPASRLGVSRIVEIDTSGGPLFGDISKQAKEDRFLAPREVVLTFDDGPMPWITRSILDTLDRHCTRATFFSVGRMAMAYPATVREVVARGHTLASHTYSHPLNIARLKPDRSVDEIERGFAAIALAAGQPIAPFFRFPGLSDSPALLDHLQTRGIAAFTVDVVSDDSFISDAGRLAKLTLARIEAKQGGIVLFHDIKASTAKALPVILTELKARGYKIVHMRAKASLVPVATYEAELLPRLAKVQPSADGKAAMVPFFGTTGPRKASEPPREADAAPAPGVTAFAPAGVGIAGNVASNETDAVSRGTVAAAPGNGPQVTALAPAPRQRFAALAARSADRKPRDRLVRRSHLDPTSAGTAVGGWSTQIRQNRLRPTLD